MRRHSSLLIVAGLTAIASLSGNTGLAQAQSLSPVKDQPLAPGRAMYIGVDYYPEHWPRERWETDAKLMKEAGFNIVRLAEFAWIDMEPREGQFDFAWLDDAIKLLGRYDIDVILGTPTAVIPAWVAQKYPQALRTKADGTQVVWGGRKHNCYSNPDYRRLSQRITRAMAEHFAQTPNVIGWQIDNEFGGEECHCRSCRADFQTWLRDKYRTLDTLNQAWGNHFWGLKFTDWTQITIPDGATDRPWVMGNPSAVLDWKRFITFQQARFQAEQVKILRAECPEDFITHNFMGLFQGLDYYVMAQDLDFVAWDNYPIWSDKPEVPYSASLAADLMRGLKGKNFVIMEQTAGPCGWEAFGRNPWPGEIRKIAYQQLAHGSDGQIWFRWRTCTVGREQYWHGLLGHDGKPLRRYQEAAQTAKEFRQLEPHLRGTTPICDVAILYDYDNLWSLNFQPGFAGNSLQTAIRRYYDALFRAGVNADLVNRSADLAKYRLVLAPDLSILPDATAAKLDAYVKNGGTLLADCRTGVKDERNLCHDRTLPGLLSPALGIRIEEYSPLPADSPCQITATDRLTGSYTAIQYTDWLTPETATPQANYTGPWHLKPFAAVTRNTYGKGKGWYVGTVMKEPAFYNALIAQLLKDADIRPVVTPPAGVEAALRQSPNKRLLFLINHTEESKAVNVPKDKIELLTDQKTGDSLTLDRFAVAVIRL